MGHTATAIGSIAGLFLTAQAAMGQTVIIDHATLNQISSSLLMCPKTPWHAEIRPDSGENCARSAVRGTKIIATLQSRYIGAQAQTDKVRMAQEDLDRNCKRELDTLDGMPLRQRTIDGVKWYVGQAAGAINGCEAALERTDKLFDVESHTLARQSVLINMNRVALLQFKQ